MKPLPYEPPTVEALPYSCSPDCSWSGVDQTDLADPEKMWRCDGCGEEGTSEALRLSHASRPAAPGGERS